MTRALDVFIVTGEQSGDQLGFKLIRALRKLSPRKLSIRGVGGPRMEKEGLKSLFPLDDIAVMGFSDVLARLPLLKRRIRETVEAVVAHPPDVLVIIDSPDFTHRVARAVRGKLPDLPVVDYVSPSVWAWRPGRARKMRAYVDRVLALLPFEPAAHRKLGGPTCTYVGHPLIERLDELRPKRGKRKRVSERVNLIVLPGSRLSVVRRHMPLFGEVLKKIASDAPKLNVTIPAAPGLKNEIKTLARNWPVKPHIVKGEDKKLAAMREANVALAVSGTGTLELALSGVPLVGAYRLESLANIVRRFVTVTAPHILLPNLILGKRAIPELVAESATAENIAAALRPLLKNTRERRAQEAALKLLDAKMKVPDAPSRMAARIVLRMAGQSTR
jgi:lipid-A-disaccharide synthase